MTEQEKIEEMASSIGECNITCDECFKQLDSVMTMRIKEREKYCQIYLFAKTAVEQGYQKLPKDSVLLTREEFERLKSQQQEITILKEENERLYNFKRKLEDELIEHGWAEYVNDKVITLSTAVEKARKETAKEILDMGNKIYEMSYYKDNAMSRLIELIKVEYGVKVKE